MSDIPQTAEGAIRLISTVIAQLPGEEQERLAYFLVVSGEY
jgi:hypothetical protein